MLESKLDLEKDTLDSLQDLLQVNYASAKGFREVAAEVDDGALEPLFRRLALQREKNIAELGAYVALNGEEPEADGLFSAKVHRAWINVRSALSSNNRRAMLEEAERGEDRIKGAYEDALKKTAGSAVNDVLTRHHRDVKVAHDRIRDLRDAAE